MSRERLEAIKSQQDIKHLNNNIVAQYVVYPFITLATSDYKWLIEQAERVEELDVYVDESSKKHAELNVFLQERKLTSTLGMHVIDAVIEHVQELEELGRHNKAYREALEFYAICGQGIGETKHGEVARKALEGEK